MSANEFYLWVVPVFVVAAGAVVYRVVKQGTRADDGWAAIEWKGTQEELMKYLAGIFPLANIRVRAIAPDLFKYQAWTTIKGQSEFQR